MIRALKYSSVLLMAVALGSCCQKMYPVQNTVHDTVTVTRQVRLRDTVFKVPGAGVSTLLDFTQRTQSFDAKNAKDSMKSVIRDLRNKQAHLVVTHTPKGLTIDCNCDTMAIQAQLRDSFIKVDHNRQEVKTVVVEKKYVPVIVKILAWMGGIFGIGIIGIIIKKVWL